MSESSDDDNFGRVLEDIQEEESEYEDLMGYRGTQVDYSVSKVQAPVKTVVPSASDLRAARFNGHNVNATTAVVRFRDNYR